jgi:hypothetical protein
MKLRLEKFNPNNKNFGKEVLKYFQKFLSENTTMSVKIEWIKKDDTLPLITITKGMDEIQKLYEKKLVSFAFDIWCNDKKTRDLITNEIINIIKNVDFGSNFSVEINNEPLTIKINMNVKEKPETENKVIIDTPQILPFEEKKGIYRSHFGLTLRVKVNVDKKELGKLQEYKERGKYFEKLVLGDSSFGGDILESKNKQYILFRPSISRETLALISKNKILWKKNFDNLVSFAFASDGSYCIVVAQLKKREMPLGWKKGGHIYVITKEGKVKDIKIPCDGLSCSISPDNNNFGITTMGPEWGVYYFNREGELIWKKIFDDKIGGIELTKDKIILYDKMHKETRKIVLVLNKEGTIKNE